jgi:hypothetical protein
MSIRKPSYGDLPEPGHRTAPIPRVLRRSIRVISLIMVAWHEWGVYYYATATCSGQEEEEELLEKTKSLVGVKPYRVAVIGSPQLQRYRSKFKNKVLHDYQLQKVWSMLTSANAIDGIIFMGVGDSSTIDLREYVQDFTQNNYPTLRTRCLVGNKKYH